MYSYRKHFKNIRLGIVSDIQSLAFGSSLFIRYNTAAHIADSNQIKCMPLSGLFIVRSLKALKMSVNPYPNAKPDPLGLYTFSGFFKNEE